MLKNYYEQLNRRQQLQTQIGVFVGIVLLFWLIIWQPVFERNSFLEQRLLQKSNQFEWMEGAAKTLSAVAGNGSASLSGSQLRQKVSQTASQLGLVINRIQESRNDAIQVQFEQVEFNKLLTLIDHLKLAGADLQRISLTKDDTPGFVSVQLVIGVAP